MNKIPPNKHGYSEEEKTRYYAAFLGHVPIRHQRCIGISDVTHERIKDIVRLIALNATTIRSYTSAIIAHHLKEYKFLHEYFRRTMYERPNPGDDKLKVPGQDYLDRYLCEGIESRKSSWIHLDSDCAEALKQIASWTGPRNTLSSFAEAIIVKHLDDYDNLLMEMKSDVFNSQPK